MLLTPATTDRALAEEWFERFEGAGLDGVVAKPLDGEYEEGKRTMQKVKHLRTADCVVGGFRMHKDGGGVGSLLLGLYDDDGVLHHVGVASSFSAGTRAELLGELEPYRTTTLDGHPWREWAEADAEAASAGQQRRPGAQSRWNAGKDLSLGAAAHRAGRRGRVRAPAGRPVPPHRALPAVAPRPRPRRRAPTSSSTRPSRWSSGRSSVSDRDSGPSVGTLAGQLGYMFEDDPSLRDAPVAQLVARLNEEDRLARAIAKYPNHTDAEIHGHLAEFHDRIGAVDVEKARRQALGEVDEG